MKALTTAIVLALTMIAGTSHATTITLPCGRTYEARDVMLTNNEGVLNASNIGQYKYNDNMDSLSGAEGRTQ